MTDEDMPKLQSPFKREMINGKYVLADKVDLDYLWVFEADDVIPVEKLDGTNVSIIVENGKIVRAYNRLNPIPVNSNDRLWQGIENSKKSFMSPFMESLPDGQLFGELIGPGIQDNPMNLKEKMWIPFNWARDILTYEGDWNTIPKDFSSIQEWMKNDVRSKLFEMIHDKDDMIPEGVVFHRKSTGDMAKLRNDMYNYWYENPDHRPHKFKDVKPPKVKTPNPMAEEIAAIKARVEQGLLPQDQFINLRNDILTKYGISVKK